MNLFLSIISIAVVLIVIKLRIISNQRRINISQLSSVYDKMEMHFIKQNIRPSNENLKFLEFHSFMVSNPSFLDVQVLIAVSIISKKKGDKIIKTKSWYDTKLDHFGDDFIKLYDEFDNISNRIIDLSMYKPSFVLFAIKCLIANAFKNGLQTFVKFKEEISFVRNNEQVISHVSKDFAI